MGRQGAAAASPTLSRDFSGRSKTGHFLSVPSRTLVRTMPAFRSFQYLLQPTARQARALEHLLGVQCEAYNAALEERREAWKRGIRITRYAQFAQLKDLHEARPDFLQYGVTVDPGDAHPPRPGVLGLLPPGRRRPEAGLPALPCPKAAS